MPKIKRDYGREYARRIKRGLALGLTRSRARGHPKPNETPKRASVKPVKFERHLEEALQAIKGGKTLTESAKMAHVAPERLRLYLADQKIVTRRGRKWTFTQDTRQRRMLFYSEGSAMTLDVDMATATWIGRYFDGVGRFISTGDDNYLWPFEGGEIVAADGRHHPYETDPNELYRLTASGGEDSFEDIYRIIP